MAPSSAPSPAPATPLATLASVDARSRRRAWRAVRCLPLRRPFYERLAQGGATAELLCGQEAAPTYGRRPLGRRVAEGHLAWLIRLGLVRHEVDGQGLTERLRLTPMGRELLGQWPREFPGADPLSRLLDGLRRRWPL